MAKFVWWLALLAVVVYPLYFLATYTLARLGILPREWIGPLEVGWTTRIIKTTFWPPSDYGRVKVAQFAVLFGMIGAAIAGWMYGKDLLPSAVLFWTMVVGTVSVVCSRLFSKSRRASHV